MQSCSWMIHGCLCDVATVAAERHRPCCRRVFCGKAAWCSPSEMAPHGYLYHNASTVCVSSVRSNSSPHWFWKWQLFLDDRRCFQGGEMDNFKWKSSWMRLKKYVSWGLDLWHWSMAPFGGDWPRCPPGAADCACPKGLRGSFEPQAQPELAWHDPWRKPLYTDYSRWLPLNQLMFLPLPNISGTLEMSGDIHH